MSDQPRGSDGSVTGVATGSLGTGTALDDTQVYEVDALTTADHPDERAAAEEAPERPVAPVPTQRPAPDAARRRPSGRRIAGYPIGIVAGAAIAVVAVAAFLTMRDGISIGGSPTGPGVFAGANSFPPGPTIGQLATAAPGKTPGAQGRGNGHGHGNGH